MSLTREFRVCLRQIPGRTLDPRAVHVDGKVFTFSGGMTQDDNFPHPGEAAWVPCDANWPAGLDVWLSSGDLVEVDA